MEYAEDSLINIGKQQQLFEREREREWTSYASPYALRDVTLRGVLWFSLFCGVSQSDIALSLTFALALFDALRSYVLTAAKIWQCWQLSFFAVKNVYVERYEIENSEI